MAKKSVKKWLPQKGKRIEVRHPVTGRMFGISEHKGFALVMVIVRIILITIIVL